MFPIANILLRADLQMFLPIPQPQFPSYLRLSPASPPSIPLRAKPALPLGRVNDRFVIVALTWHVIDTVACFADVPLMLHPLGELGLPRRCTVGRGCCSACGGMR